MHENMPNRQIACIDARSFYASCAAADNNLDVMTTPIVVIGNKDRKGSIVLAASPLAKQKFGIKSAQTRYFELPDDPSLIVIEPKMEFYVKISMEIARLLGQYVPKEAIHIYSIDEAFFDLKGTESIWGPIEDTIKRIQDDLLEQFQIPTAVGMGPNMLLSKLALDLEAKKTGFARWGYEDVENKLWPLSPLREMWGIGSRTEKTLNSMGIFNVGDLARTDLKTIEAKFGVAMGNQLFYHAWGIDISELGAPLVEGQVSYGKGQMLYRDYRKLEDIHTVILEMCEDVAFRARQAGKAGRTIALGIGYSRDSFGGGFNRSKSIEEETNDTMKIYEVCKQLLKEHYDGRPVRHVNISITKLVQENSMQLSLFEQSKWRNRKLGAAMDSIRSKYGSTAILRAVSYTEAGTAIDRAQLVGGHKK